jgi:hypothetical protein
VDSNYEAQPERGDHWTAVIYSASTVFAAIDGIALLLAGSREHFHLKGRGRGEDGG